MITPTEQERVKILRNTFLDSAVQIYGIDIEPDSTLHAEFVGANMATVDALFAIREGEPWRGIEDPKEIAREVLRMGQIGDQPGDPT